MRVRRGLTLIELLVVIAIVAVLFALLLPAVQSAREAARRTQCKNNLRQIGLALHSYAEANRVFPPSFVFGRTASWSIHGRLLPFLELQGAADQIQLDLEWDDPINLASGVQQLPVKVYSCPSDPNSDTLADAGPGEGLVRPVSYGFNFGSWFIFDPQTGHGGDGCFFPNSSIGPDSIGDGLSHTLATAEVKTFQAVFVNTADPGPHPPHSPGAISGYAGGATFFLGATLNDNTGHTEWCDGPVHESGFTTVFTPNTVVSYLHSDGRTYDVDYNSRYEGTSRTQRSYAAVTSRSYHAGLVHVLLLDGSVHSISSTVAHRVWHAMGSRSCGEVVSGY